MTLISWRDDYQVGVPLIDGEHRYLIGLINEFHDKHASGDGHRQVMAVLNSLVSYAEQHFQHEEALMAEIGYPRLAQQREMHEELFSSIFALNEELSRDSARIDAKTMRFLQHWLLAHIIKEDMGIGDFARRKTAQAERVGKGGARVEAADAIAAKTPDTDEAAGAGATHA